MTPSRNAFKHLLNFRIAVSASRSLTGTAHCCSSPLLSGAFVTVRGTQQSSRKNLKSNGARSFASSASPAEETKFGREMQIRLVRMIAFGMIMVAATKVVPMMFQSTVPHAIQLCSAKEPIMQRSAANRVSRLAENDESLQDLIAAGVCPRLLAMLKAGVDPGVATAVLSAMKEISRLPEGREALKLAGAPAVLNKSLQQHWLSEQQDISEATKIARWLMTR